MRTLCSCRWARYVTGVVRNAQQQFFEYKLYAAAVRRQLGSLKGGDAGQALIKQADEAMEEENIVDKARLSAMLAPGFEKSS